MATATCTYDIDDEIFESIINAFQGRFGLLVGDYAEAGTKMDKCEGAKLIRAKAISRLVDALFTGRLCEGYEREIRPYHEAEYERKLAAFDRSIDPRPRVHINTVIRGNGFEGCLKRVGQGVEICDLEERETPEEVELRVYRRTKERNQFIAQFGPK